MKTILLFIVFIGTQIATQAQCWESISVGETHVMGIQTNGTLWGWGNGQSGLLGNGNEFTKTSPEQIGIDTNWIATFAGRSHSFGIKENGTLWAWGSNFKGNLGSGGSAMFSLIPVQIGNNLWKTVSPGYDHSIGIKSDGTLWGWGDNEKATVGDGTFINRPIPVMINSSTNWNMVDSNLNRNIALKEDGTIWVWGMNSPNLGVPGLLSDVPYITIPTQAGIDTDYKAVAAGFGFFLALKTDNTLWSWGVGNSGQLGNGSTGSELLPTQVGDASDWQSVTADNQSCLGVKTDGTLWAWGKNLWGNLGDGTQTNLLIPTQITTSTYWKIVSTSAFATAALKIDGSLYSWGIRSYGQIGDGNLDDTVQLAPLLINTCNLGTEDFNKSKVKLYPNPVQHQLFIDTQETQTYQIYSILGVKISEGRLSVGSSIDCSGLTSGVYLLSLTDNEGLSKTVKFVKQ